jgi:hypothetical protein
VSTIVIHDGLWNTVVTGPGVARPAMEGSAATRGRNFSERPRRWTPRYEIPLTQVARSAKVLCIVDNCVNSVLLLRLS